MTEAEWLASTDPSAMLAWATMPAGLDVPSLHLRAAAPPSDRKLRLFAVACMRMAGIPPERADEVERDGPPRLEPTEALASDATFARAWTEKGSGKPTLAEKANLLREIIGNPFRPVKLGCGRGDACPTHRPDYLTPQVLSLALAAYDERERKCEECNGVGVLMAGLSRSFGRTVDCPRCRGTGRVEDGTLDAARLLILSDALEEAGCGGEDLLRHLRGQERCQDPFSMDSVGHRDASGFPTCRHCGNTNWQPLRGPHVRGCWAIDLLLGKE